MANSKISALPVASTPLAGTELVPIVQGGITEQVSVANLTAGRAVGALSLSTTQGITGGSLYSVSGFSGYRASGASISSPGDASMYFNSATGQTLQARAGSSYDWSLINPGNANYIAQVPTGTLDFRIAGGNVIQGTAAKGFTTGGAFNLGLGTNGSTSQVQVDTSGSLLIGATTTAGTINNSVNVVGGVFITASGSTSIPNATATTIVTLPNLGTGVYIVTASIPGAGGASLYASTVLITTQATTSVVSPLHSTAAITFTLSGLAVQVTQTAGATYTFAWTVIRLT